VADADVILTFWNGTTYYSLVHELGREQPKTTKELLDITTRHSLGEEAVEATCMMISAGTATSGGWATPTSTAVRSTKKAAKGRKKGQKHRLHHLATVSSNGNTGERSQEL
jgi:hypothetical protein